MRKLNKSLLLWSFIVIGALALPLVCAASVIFLGDSFYVLPNQPQTDNSETYCHGDFNKIIINSSEEIETYSVVISALSSAPIIATGSRVGNNLTLSASSHGYNFSYDFIFSNNDINISGQIEITGDGANFVWNEYGAKGACPTIDISENGVPKFINNDFVNLADDINDISLFRSSYGHDYSDSFEQCRSMKHYFSPPSEKRLNNTVPVFSPINGKIVHLSTEEENFTDDGVTNQLTIIQSNDYPGVLVTLFHIDLNSSSLVVGTELTAGQQIGFGRMVYPNRTGHDFDISIHANTSSGVRYISYFDTMTDSLFSNYISWGEGGDVTRSSFIITEAARDLDPLTCNGETFTSSGTLPAWYYNRP